MTINFCDFYLFAYSRKVRIEFSLLVTCNRKVKKLTLLSGSSYFRNSTVFYLQTQRAAFPGPFTPARISQTNMVFLWRPYLHEFDHNFDQCKNREKLSKCPPTPPIWCQIPASLGVATSQMPVVCA